MVRVCVVGGGLAGSLLAWRLSQHPGTQVHLVVGSATAADATSASGGAVRAYERLAHQRELAVASLAELAASAVLRDWAGYRPVGFTYLRQDPDGLAGELAEIQAVLPESVDCRSADELRREGWSGLPAGCIGIIERQAGYVDPEALRAAVQADLASRGGHAVSQADLVELAADASAAGSGPATGPDLAAVGRPRLRLAGVTQNGPSAPGYDVVVLATGGWTGRLLRASGLAADGYRTKAIQYSIFDVENPPPGPFCDEWSGLYGKPTADGGLLLGVPTEEWDVTPGRPPVTARWHDQAAILVEQRRPGLRLGRIRSQMSATDCYCDPPVLGLRPVWTAGREPMLVERTFTFTGGSGSSVKTALAASDRAASDLLAGRVAPIGQPVLGYRTDR